MFPVTRPLLPDLDRVRHYLEQAHARAWLTNFGPLHEELTERLKAYLGVEHLLLVSNGTLALQVAYRVLGLTGRVLTTPYSFAATTSSLIWEGLEPVFVDIDSKSLNIDSAKLEAAGPASGIVAVHVYGNPCDVEALETFAAARGMPVLYDAAHAFGSTFDGAGLLRWGDAATLSFHATKIFHTVEGGAIVFREEGAYRAARELINFGIRADGELGPFGTNCKLSEYHAAAGLALMDGIGEVVEHRSGLAAEYRNLLDGWVDFQAWSDRGRENGAYMPVLLADETQCVLLKAELEERGVQTRRYFYPSLNRTAATAAHSVRCPVSEDIASRVLCLPLYADLRLDEVRQVAETVKDCLRSGNRASHGAVP